MGVFIPANLMGPAGCLIGTLPTLSFAASRGVEILQFYLLTCIVSIRWNTTLGSIFKYRILGFNNLGLHNRDGVQSIRSQLILNIASVNTKVQCED